VSAREKQPGTRTSDDTEGNGPHEGEEKVAGAAFTPDPKEKQLLSPLIWKKMEYA